MTEDQIARAAAGISANGLAPGAAVIGTGKALAELFLEKAAEPGANIPALLYYFEKLICYQNGEISEVDL